MSGFFCFVSIQFYCDRVIPEYTRCYLTECGRQLINRTKAWNFHRIIRRNNHILKCDWVLYVRSEMKNCFRNYNYETVINFRNLMDDIIHYSLHEKFQWNKEREGTHFRRSERVGIRYFDLQIKRSSLIWSIRWTTDLSFDFRQRVVQDFYHNSCLGYFFVGDDFLTFPLDPRKGNIRHLCEKKTSKPMIRDNHVNNRSWNNDAEKKKRKMHAEFGKMVLAKPSRKLCAFASCAVLRTQYRTLIWNRRDVAVLLVVFTYFSDSFLSGVFHRDFCPSGSDSLFNSALFFVWCQSINLFFSTHMNSRERERETC